MNPSLTTVRHRNSFWFRSIIDIRSPIITRDRTFSPHTQCTVTSTVFFFASQKVPFEFSLVAYYACNIPSGVRFEFDSHFASFFVVLLILFVSLVRHGECTESRACLTVGQCPFLYLYDRYLCRECGDKIVPNSDKVRSFECRSFATTRRRGSKQLSM